MIQRGEIYFVDLNPVKGREQAGRRPVLVLSVDAINKLPLVVTVIVGRKAKTCREIIRQTFAFPPKKAVWRWKPSFYVFRFARLTRIVFRNRRRENFC
jgi:mRNA interferase MazF